MVGVRNGNMLYYMLGCIAACSDGWNNKDIAIVYWTDLKIL